MLARALLGMLQDTVTLSWLLDLFMPVERTRGPHASSEDAEHGTWLRWMRGRLAEILPRPLWPSGQTLV